MVPVTGSRRGERGDDRMRIAEQDAQDQDGGGGWPVAGAGGRRHVTPPARVAASPAVFHGISQGNEPPLCVFPAWRGTHVSGGMGRGYGRWEVGRARVHHPTGARRWFDDMRGGAMDLDGVVRRVRRGRASSMDGALSWSSGVEAGHACSITCRPCQSQTVSGVQRWHLRSAAVSISFRASQ